VRVLGIDSATAQASVGLWVDGVIRDEQQTSSRNHAASLLPLVDGVLNAAATEIGAVDLLAVSAGPGSFSGLRVGVSVAKGLALANRIPVVGVSTLEALAATVASFERTICAVLDAFKGEVYFASFRTDHGNLRRLSDDVVVTPDRAATMVPPRAVLLGDGIARYASLFREHIPESVTVLPFPEYGPRGGAVARLGVAHHQRHGDDSAARLEPFYIRPPEVQVNI